MTTNAKNLVSDEMVETACSAYHTGWSDKPYSEKNIFRRCMRAPLEAIVPMLAQAGDAVSEPAAWRITTEVINEDMRPAGKKTFVTDDGKQAYLRATNNAAVTPLYTAPHDDGKVARDAEELQRLRALVNSPELHDFAKGVVLEAGHQRERWGNDHDAGKEPADWFWLIGYLSGKALAAHQAGNTDKALHHTISSAAALANWHGAILGTHNMRPGIDGGAAIKEQRSPSQSTGSSGSEK